MQARLLSISLLCHWLHLCKLKLEFLYFSMKFFIQYSVCHTIWELHHYLPVKRHKFWNCFYSPCILLGSLFNVSLLCCNGDIQCYTCFYCCICLDDWLWELLLLLHPKRFQCCKICSGNLYFILIVDLSYDIYEIYCFLHIKLSHFSHLSVFRGL